MYTPTQDQFLEKAKQGNLVPVWRELLADQDTPLSCYERLCAHLKARGYESASTFLLESVEGGEHIARYSFLGGLPRAMIRSKDGVTEIDENGQVQRFETSDPLTVLQDYMAQFKPVTDDALPRFFGGAVGYLGYDMIRHFEPRVPINRENSLDWPEMVFMVADAIIIFDRVRHTLKVVVNAFIENDPAKAYQEAVARVDELCEALATSVPHVLVDAGEEAEDLPLHSNMTPSEFGDAVERCKEYIRAGDIIQAVLSQRFEVERPGSPHAVYRALRSVNPSPYMYCLEFGPQCIVGSSPEVHVRCEDGMVEVRPIAGTRPRGVDAETDRALADELLADPKERAEHIMLVDLGRNDIGRVCKYGTVRVPELMTIERYSHVMHIVSDVVGRMDDRHTVYDLMRSTFPAGTVSGAPKIRAMEIIAELESVHRGPYAGAVGYFSFTGNLDSCITIRTVLMDGDRAYVQAGAGIVADSDPEKEYQETCNKARGMLKALALSRHFEQDERSVS
jgi:anthranilate synthase component 1